MFKRTLQVIIGFALTMQLAGCFYEGDDHRWHEGGHHEHHEDHDHGGGIDVNFHG